jgi:hypothetical protein
MTRLWRGSLALAAVVCVVVQTAPAAAEGEPETGAFGAFRLKGTNGFSIFVMAYSKPRFKHGEVALFVVGKGEAAFYLAPAKVGPTAIEADLGPVGEIAVQFESSGSPEWVRSRCKGGGVATYEPGAWVGTIDFEGEEGFTRATRSRTKAVVSPFFDLGCGSRGIGETLGSREPGARLVARSISKRGTLVLQANKNRRSASVHLEASIEERHGGLIVSREVSGFFPHRAFEFDSSLRTATLSPPAPFTGHAAFRRNANPANRWTGNLSVDFPGRAGVPLAGGRFKSTLVHAKRTEQVTHCDRLTRARADRGGCPPGAV